MGDDTNFDPTGEKKARKKATMGGAIACGIFNAVLGVALGFLILSLSAPPEYKPKPDAKTGKIPPPPATLFYWAGAPGGDYRSKEAQLLVDKPGSVTISDLELNAWAAATFKGAPSRPTPVAKAAPPKGTSTSDVDKAKAEAKAVEADLQSFGVNAGTPNFHIFKDPAAPADAPLSFQIALPMTVDIAGDSIETVYQARGTFVAGPAGPEFKPYVSYLGNARIPGPLAGTMFHSLFAKFAASDEAKKYADAWAKLASANVQEGALVLAGK